MSSFDYSDFVTTVLELISQFGRSITVNRYKQEPTDSSKPWRGPTDPIAFPDASASVKAVFEKGAAASSHLKSIDPDLINRVEEVCYIGPTTFDLMTANDIVDGGQHRRIVFVEQVKPADTVLLYIMGVLR